MSVRRPADEQPEPTEEPFIERDVKGGPSVYQQVFDVVVDLKLGDLIELQGEQRGFEVGGPEGSYEEYLQRRGQRVLDGHGPEAADAGGHGDGEHAEVVEDIDVGREGAERRRKEKSSGARV